MNPDVPRSEQVDTLCTTDIVFPAESPELNPYATPATVLDAPQVYAATRRTPWLRRSVVLQAIVIVTSPRGRILQARVHSVVGTDFSLVGLAIAIVAFRNRDRIAMFFGGSAIVFAALIVFLVNYNSWGPQQGDRPITILSFIYAAFALPISVWLAFARYSFAGNHPMQPSGEFGRFQMDDQPSPPADR